MNAAQHVSSHPRVLATILAALGFSALATEYHFLLAEHHPARVVHATAQFLSFFTVISNLLVAGILTIYALCPQVCTRAEQQHAFPRPRSSTSS